MTKDCQNPKKEKEIRKCYKCDKAEHLVKDCRTGQKMKNRSVQEDTNEEDNNKQEGFVGGPE